MTQMISIICPTCLQRTTIDKTCIPHGTKNVHEALQFGLTFAPFPFCNLPNYMDPEGALRRTRGNPEIIPKSIPICQSCHLLLSSYRKRKGADYMDYMDAVEHVHRQWIQDRSGLVSLTENLKSSNDPPS